MSKQIFDADGAAEHDLIADFLIRGDIKCAEELRDKYLADLDENCKKEFWIAIFFGFLMCKNVVFGEQHLERFFEHMPQFASYWNADIFGKMDSYNQSVLKFAMRKFHDFFVSPTTFPHENLMKHIMETCVSEEMIDFIFASFTADEIHELYLIERIRENTETLCALARHGVTFKRLKIYAGNFEKLRTTNFSSFHKLVSAGATLDDNFALLSYVSGNINAMMFMCEHHRLRCCSDEQFRREMTKILQEILCDFSSYGYKFTHFVKTIDILLKNGANPFCVADTIDHQSLVDILEVRTRITIDYECECMRKMLKHIRKLQMIPFLRSEQAGILDTFVCKGIFELMCE